MRWIKNHIKHFVEKAGKLRGDPHYVALGMAIGVFVAVTPTIPFHTIIAVILAYIIKGSKPAAVLGVWVSNPVTVLFLYYISYKAGILLFGESNTDAGTVKLLVANLEKDIDIYEKFLFFADFIKTKVRLFLIMVTGGVLLGLPAGFFAYFITRAFIVKIRRAREKLKKKGGRIDTSG